MDEIERWAKAQRHRVEMLPAELDAKGDNPDRPILRRAVDGVKAAEYGGVVVAYLSRAGRDLRVMLDLWDEVESAGGIVYSARENIDGSTPSGRLQRNLLAAIAQHELEERREGFDQARRGAVETGIWPQRQTPRGYRRRPDRRLEPDERAGEVRAAFDAYLRGTTISDIARRLQMTQSGVRQLLRNRIYLGELTVGSYTNEAAYEPIVDVATFEAVQHELDNGVRPARGNGGPALLAGVVRCASCGHRMTRSGHTSRKGGPSYACPARHSGEHCPAPAAIAVHLLDQYVERRTLDELEKLRVTARRRGDTVAKAQAAADAAERDRDGFLAALSGTTVDPQAVRREADRRQRVVDEAREALRVEAARDTNIPWTGTGAYVWTKLDARQRNAVLRGALAAVVVRPVGRGRRAPVGDRVRILTNDTPLVLPGGGPPEKGGGIVPLWPDPNSPGVLGVPTREKSS